jgi:hypothetical protein
MSIRFEYDCVVIDGLKISDAAIYMYMTKHIYARFYKYFQVHFPDFDRDSLMSQEVIQENRGGRIIINDPPLDVEELRGLLDIFPEPDELKQFVAVWRYMKIATALLYHIAALSDMDVLRWKTKLYYDIHRKRPSSPKVGNVYDEFLSRVMTCKNWLNNREFVEIIENTDSIKSILSQDCYVEPGCFIL